MQRSRAYGSTICKGRSDGGIVVAEQTEPPIQCRMSAMERGFCNAMERGFCYDVERFLQSVNHTHLKSGDPGGIRTPDT